MIAPYGFTLSLVWRSLRGLLNMPGVVVVVVVVVDILCSLVVIQRIIWMCRQ